MKPNNQSLLFKDEKIHFIPDKNGTPELFNLGDICKALHRTEMMETGEALRLSRYQCKLPMYANGKLYWFVRVSDIHSITNAVRKENSIAAKECDELNEWLVKLLTHRAGKKEHKKVITLPVKQPAIQQRTVDHDDNTNLAVFNYNDQQISFKAKNGRLYYNATEMARSFNKNPREWLLLAQTSKFRQSLVDQGKSESLSSQIITVRGSFGCTWIEESLGMEFSRWLSPEFSNWCNDRMQDLFTRGFVTLKKEDEKLFTTSYGEQKKLPTDFKEALLMLAEAQDHIAEKQKKIELDKPKVNYYNEFIENRDNFTTYFIAEELRTSTVNLYRFLVEERIVYFNKKLYCVYPNYSPLQCDQPYYWTNPKTGKTYKHSFCKRWTKAGREFILDLYKEKFNNKEITA